MGTAREGAGTAGMYECLSKKENMYDREPLLCKIPMLSRSRFKKLPTIVQKKLRSEETEKVIFKEMSRI